MKPGGEWQKIQILGVLFILGSEAEKELSYPFSVIFWNAHLLAQRFSLLRGAQHEEEVGRPTVEFTVLAILRENAEIYLNVKRLCFIVTTLYDNLKQTVSLGDRAEQTQIGSSICPNFQGDDKSEVYCSQGTVCAWSVSLISCLGK